MTTPTVESIELPIINDDSLKSEFITKKKRVKYDIELLKNIIKRDNCKINLNLYKNVKRDTKISFVCNCGESGHKNFRSLYEDGGGFCKKCKKSNALEKSKNTCLHKYNVEFTFQSENNKNKSKETCLERYNVEHPSQSDVIKEKYKQTNLKNLGVEYPLQSENIKNKFKKTCLEKYDVEYPMQSNIIKEKMKTTNTNKYQVEYPLQCQNIKEKFKKTCLEKYDVEYPSQSEIIKEKIKLTCLEKYSVENPSQSELIKEKKRETCLSRYNTEHNMQCAEIAEKCLKNCFKTKQYQLPSGKIIQIQGYENFALDELLFEERINEDDIITNRTEVPEIWYYKDNKNHRYYTDIYIKSLNKCIEVKSEYTSKKNKDIIKLKEDSTSYLGYDYEIRVYDKKGNRI